MDVTEEYHWRVLWKYGIHGTYWWFPLKIDHFFPPILTHPYMTFHTFNSNYFSQVPSVPSWLCSGSCLSPCSPSSSSCLKSPMSWLLFILFYASRHASAPFLPADCRPLAKTTPQIPLTLKSRALGLIPWLGYSIFSLYWMWGLSNNSKS